MGTGLVLAGSDSFRSGGVILGLARLRYEQANDVCCLVKGIVEQGFFPHVNPRRVRCVRSWGSRSRAVARIHGLSGAWVAAGFEPGYVIEVIAERFDKLSFHEKVKVIVHELLHIPSTFSGGLRPHGKHVNGRIVYRISKRLDYRLLERCV